VIADRVPGLLGLLVLVPPLAELQQLGVEVQLLGLRVHLEHRGQPGPERAERPGVGPVDVVQHGEHPPLLVMIGKDDLGDVHGGHLPPAAVQA
jgi:hypothetical protein